MVGLHTAATSPQPPPSTHDKEIKNTMEVFMKQRSGPFIVKTICWTAAVAESAVIVANNAPRLKLSQEILSMLVVQGSAERIRFSPVFLAGTLLTGLGGFIRYQCYRELGRLFTFEMAIRKDHRLITSGPYSIVRHPAYTGVLLTVVGIVCWHAGSGSWVRECGPLRTRIGQGAICLYAGLMSLIMTGLMTRMSVEDEALEKTFGKEWTEWEKRVPCRLIPWLY